MSLLRCSGRAYRMPQHSHRAQTRAYRVRGRDSTAVLPGRWPTNTRPPAIAGGESTRARVVNVQSGLPVFASSACTILSRPPSTTCRRRSPPTSRTSRTGTDGLSGVFPEQFLALPIERHHFVVEKFTERGERSCTRSEQPVRSMEWVGDFSLLKSTDLGMVDLTFTSWNPLTSWLQQIEALQRAA
jgi:hypothetical protein